MMIVTRAAVAMDICDKRELDRLKKALDSASLPTSCQYSAKELTEIALADKKRNGDKINLVIPYSVGDSRLLKINVTELESFIKKGLIE
jgi:3-dehydroquinate synthetase